MTHLRLTSSVAAVAAVVALASCSSTSPSASPTAGAPTTAPSSAASTTTPPPATTTAPAAKARTVAHLKAALLDKSDVPSGYSLDTSDSKGPSPKSTSTDAKCADFNTLMNLDKAPGSTAQAHVSMDGGQNGPVIDESLDALASPTAVRALTKRLQAAVDGCRSIKLTLPTGESSTVKVSSVTAPQAGTTPVAARLSATSGTLAGLELTMVWTGVDDVLLTMSFMGSVPDEIDGATQTAVDKAQTSLGAGSVVS